MHLLKTILITLALCTQYHCIGKDVVATPPKETEEEASKIDLFFQPDQKLTAQVDAIYQKLSPQQRAAQMIMTASSTAANIGYPYATAKSLVTNDIAANVVFLKGKSTEFKQQTKELNALKKQQLVPLFACDCEPTLLPYKWTDITGITPAAQQETEEQVKENTEKINQILKRVGVQLNFAPVADIAVNKSVINKRAFGNNPATIATLSNLFIQTTQEEGLGATLKHFPGHGAVKGDSHKQSVYIDGNLSELNTFKSIIQSNNPPVSVMVGHIVVRNNKKYDTKGLPATLSRTIVTDLLRNELKYNGIITTDALNMIAAAKVPDADWKAVLAGVDLVLMPKDAKALNKKIVTALNGQDALAQQLEASIKRIIRLKLSLLQP